MTGVAVILTPHEYYAALVAGMLGSFSLGMILIGVWVRR